MLCPCEKTEVMNHAPFSYWLFSLASTWQYDSRPSLNLTLGNYSYHDSTGRYCGHLVLAQRKNCYFNGICFVMVYGGGWITVVYSYTEDDTVKILTQFLPSSEQLTIIEPTSDTKIHRCLSPLYKMLLDLHIEYNLNHL